MTDPNRQLLGKLAKEEGKRFESRLDESFAYYQMREYALIEKTPEPMRPTKNLGDGKFIAYFEGKAQPDYKGTVAGGRTVMFEAKFTRTDRIEQGRVGEKQTEYMHRASALGARCFVVCGFKSGAVYRVPWHVWVDMKELFGRKYVMEADLKEYQIRSSRDGTLMLLD